jgi:hypothetical protein
MMLAVDPYTTKRITSQLLFTEPRVSQHSGTFSSHFFDPVTQMYVEAFPELHITSYEPQSGSLGTIQEQGVADMTAEITTFNEQDAGWTTTIGSGSDATMITGKTSDATLGSFLGRPVKIASIPWSVGQPLFNRLDPWDLFLKNKAIVDKINNYELYRSKLHVKVIISGTGFHYGRALVSYNPYSGFDDITLERNFVQADIIQASQKPHFFLNPANNTGGQLDLPFFWHDNYLSLTTKADYAKMGQLVLKSINNLEHANGGNDAVNITVYAWASDVELSMPTSLPLYTPQSGNTDEYGQGIVSKTASAVAAAAGELTAVPLIAPYARATQMVAGSAGKVAAHFGYSRPNVITDSVQMKPLPTGNLVNTDAADTSIKLTFDSKQETTIDSRTTGLDGEDQMDIVRFCKRESYLTTFTMAPTQNADALLWNTKVTPVNYSSFDGELHLTPSGYMSLPFNQWQGSIKYRFQVVKSNFHKGKVLVRWDPNSHTSTVEYNTAYSRIIDLAECDDFEITVGWGQSVPFLKAQNPDLSFVPYSSSVRLPTNKESQNGVLEVAVVNNLVSPAADTSISFNVFVSACDDIKFMEPGTGYKQYSIYKPQSGIIYEPQSGEAILLADESTDEVDAPVGAETIESIAETLEPADETMTVFFGEKISSIRQMCKRFIRTRIDVLPAAIFTDFVEYTKNDRGLGYWAGWDPNGIDTETGFKCNITVPTYAQFFLPCYAGWKGGTRIKYMFDGNFDKIPVAHRSGYNNAPYLVQDLKTYTSSESQSKLMTARFGQLTAMGSAATNLGVNNTLECEIPYYNGVRFSPARMPSSDFGNGAQSARLCTSLKSNTESIANQVSGTVFTWLSVGEDFTCFFFTGCPVLYKYEITPAE